MKSAPPTAARENKRSQIDQPLHAAQLADALLKMQTVRAVTALSASSVYRKVADGTFPAPVKLGPRWTRWKSADIAAWVRGQEAAR